MGHTAPGRALLEETVTTRPGAAPCDRRHNMHDETKSELARSRLLLGQHLQAERIRADREAVSAYTWRCAFWVALGMMAGSHAFLWWAGR